MITAEISFDIDTTDAETPLGIAVWVNNDCVYQTDHVTEQYHFAHSVDDSDAEHELRIVMSGKSTEHTKIDQQGNIIKDAMLSIRNVVIDGIEIDQLFIAKAVYHHDFNGTQSEITDTFHSFMGCNGTLSFQFTTPAYMWLLENL